MLVLLKHGQLKHDLCFALAIALPHIYFEHIMVKLQI